MPNKEKISAEKKVQIVREYLSNRIGIAEAARRVGADEETVYDEITRLGWHPSDTHQERVQLILRNLI